MARPVSLPGEVGPIIANAICQLPPSPRRVFGDRIRDGPSPRARPRASTRPAAPRESRIASGPAPKSRVSDGTRTLDRLDHNEGLTPADSALDPAWEAGFGRVALIGRMSISRSIPGDTRWFRPQFRGLGPNRERGEPRRESRGLLDIAQPFADPCADAARLLHLRRGRRAHGRARASGPGRGRTFSRKRQERCL
jgi:hypothetical protein